MENRIPCSNEGPDAATVPAPAANLLFDEIAELSDNSLATYGVKWAVSLNPFHMHFRAL